MGVKLSEGILPLWCSRDDGNATSSSSSVGQKKAGTWNINAAKKNANSGVQIEKKDTTNNITI